MDYGNPMPGKPKPIALVHERLYCVSCTRYRVYGADTKEAATVAAIKDGWTIDRPGSAKCYKCTGKNKNDR